MSISTIKQYNIYHPIEGGLNQNCSLDIIFGFVASVKAENLVRSFYESQNDFNEHYSNYNIRSTCVGDIVVSGKDIYMFMGSGLKRINSKHILYKQIRSIDSKVLPLEEEEEVIENSY